MNTTNGASVDEGRTPVEPGSKVRISFNADYHNKAAFVAGHCVTAGGLSVVVPDTAEITVLEKPLPEEPPVGRYVRGLYSHTVYLRRLSTGWARIGGESGERYTWEELNEKHGRGNLLVLVPDPLTEVKVPQGFEWFDAVGDSSKGRARLQVKQVAGRVEFRFPYGERMRMEHSTARELAYVILKSTGGL